jgi:hypothetical protein
LCACYQRVIAVPHGLMCSHQYWGYNMHRYSLGYPSGSSGLSSFGPAYHYALLALAGCQGLPAHVPQLALRTAAYCITAQGCVLSSS